MTAVATRTSSPTNAALLARPPAGRPALRLSPAPARASSGGQPLLPVYLGRRESIEALTEQLRAPRDNSLELNAFLARALCEFGAKQSAPAVERAFLQQQVDLSIITWDEVVKALGL